MKESFQLKKIYIQISLFHQKTFILNTGAWKTIQSMPKEKS
jgi:hypothetical protein